MHKYLIEFWLGITSWFSKTAVSGGNSKIYIKSTLKDDQIHILSKNFNLFIIL